MDVSEWILAAVWQAVQSLAAGRVRRLFNTCDLYIITFQKFLEAGLHLHRR
jgi:hypothetical protein